MGVGELLFLIYRDFLNYLSTLVSLLIKGQAIICGVLSIYFLDRKQCEGQVLTKDSGIRLSKRYT